MSHESERPTYERLLEILHALHGKRVAVFGDLVLDEFLVGRIDRVSREAPVLILEHQEVRRVPGGGANAVANVAALGGVPLPVGIVGDDEAGDALVGLLESDGIDVSGIGRLPGHPTPTKTRVLAGSSTSVQQQVVRIDRGLRRSVPAEARDSMDRHLEGLLASAQALLVSDYGHGTVDEVARSALSERAGSWDGVYTVDSRRELAGFRGMTAATPNLEEASGALGRSIPDQQRPASEAAARLRETLDAKSLVITRGSHGMTVVGPDGASFHLPVFGTDEVADVTGAGDTVIATLTLALTAGASILEAAHLSNVAAGLVVMKRGTATVGPPQIRAALERVDHAG